MPRFKSPRWPLLCGLWLAAARAFPASPEDPALDAVENTSLPVAFRRVHGEDTRFDRPVWCCLFPGRDDTFLVVEHMAARAWLLEGQGETARRTLFADFGPEVSDGPWEGFMCLAFHPKFLENRRYFIKHEAILDGQRHTLVVEKEADSELQRDSGKPGKRLLAVLQPADNHNGGTVLFGPDGYLYIGMGDGGPQEDPEGHSQNPASFLGKMLRLDVNQAEGALPYGIPPSNPFVGRPGWQPEIWALGLREPWRFSFDPQTGDLWCGDVGQVRYEEVSILRAGENHGWNVLEGFHPFSDRYRRPGQAYVPPVAAYSHTVGVSITGGEVYRGDPESPFFGVYICGDYGTLRVFGITQEDRALRSIRQIGTAPAPVTAFARGPGGDLYLVGYDGFLYRIDLAGASFP